MADGDILTGRKPGYLACIDNVPPLIFRFQINPEIMTEKRTYKYDPAQKWGAWNFDQSAAAGPPSAFPGLDSLTNALDKVKTFAASLVNTAPLEAKEGEQRSFAIDFTLDARLADVLDEGDHFGGSIEPDLFVLRSFVNPSLDLIEFGKWALSGFKKFKSSSFKPPQCSLFMVGLSVTCVMTDLQIKGDGLWRRRQAGARRCQRHAERANSVVRPDRRVLPAQRQRGQELQTQEYRHRHHERDADSQPVYVSPKTCRSSTPRAISDCRSTM